MLNSNAPVNNDSNDSGLTSDRYVVVGLGLTGMSCVRYLVSHAVTCVENICVVDSREIPPGLTELKAELPEIDITLGSLNSDLLCTADYLIVSPGVALDEPAIVTALAGGAQLISDIDLFGAAVLNPQRSNFGDKGAKIAAITGSNGKSTVASLLHAMALRNGDKSTLCGNIGVPVLDVVDSASTVFVVELSSFQLERCHTLCPTVATVLNVSADHMDRYEGLTDYQLTKLAIYNNCEKAVFNREDALTQPQTGAALVSIGFDEPASDDYGVVLNNGKQWIARGSESLIAVKELKMPGRHNVLNAMAALAMGESLGLSRHNMLEELRQFTGLPHRCEWVADISGARYINDSKGTNTGATIAAIDGLAVDGKRSVILIAGGIGKDADFSELSASVGKAVKAAILFGRDAGQIQQAIQNHTDVKTVSDLNEAVKAAHDFAKKEDVVLFSPACASFDMFDSFEHRGQAFCNSVHALKRAVA